VPAEHVQAAASLLSGSGLLEDGGEGAADSRINGDTLAFFRRYVGVTGVNRNGQAAYEKLAGREVGVADCGGACARAERMTRLLAQTGLAHVSARHWEELKSWPASLSAAPLILSLSLHGEESASQRALDDWCAERRLPWLRAVVDEEAGYADVGPLFQPGLDACYRCLEQVHGRSRSGTGSSETATPDVWVSLIAVELVYLLSGIGPALSGRGFRRYDLRSGASLELAVVRVPGCRRCRPLQAAARATVLAEPDPVRLETALVLEDYVGLESRRAVQPPAAAGV